MAHYQLTHCENYNIGFSLKFFLVEFFVYTYNIGTHIAKGKTAVM